MISKHEEFLAYKNKDSKEPALKVGSAVGSVAGILYILGFVFPDFLTEKQTNVILVVSAFLLPIITAIFTRGKVWSPATVEEIIDEAVTESERIIKERAKKNSKEVGDIAGIPIVTNPNIPEGQLYLVNKEDVPGLIKNFENPK